MKNFFLHTVTIFVQKGQSLVKKSNQNLNWDSELILNFNMPQSCIVIGSLLLILFFNNSSWWFKKRFKILEKTAVKE